MSVNLTPIEFQKLTGVSRETLDQLVCYSELLSKWQKSINLVSNSTIQDMWLRHFYDSAQLIDYIKPSEEPLTIMDIGSGAGFPALVLSILGAGKIHVVESNGKKCAFMKQVVQKTGIDVILHNERIEKMDVFPVDIITSRACADLDKLFELSSNFINPHTECLFLKGEKADEEIKNANARWNFNVSKYKSKSEESGVILQISHIMAC